MSVHLRSSYVFCSGRAVRESRTIPHAERYKIGALDGIARSAARTTGRCKGTLAWFARLTGEARSAAVTTFAAVHPVRVARRRNIP